ncbi:MAG: PTS sugar transporter subunit IIC [Elusimicrobiota bacterium]|nr:PTS sugar transporter subunit IIC [Elusimicrobiota bacterium]
MSALATVWGGAAAVAAAELDTASIGPFLLSRPIVLGPLLGAALGEPGRGAALGAALELCSLRALPVGGALSWNAAVAAGTAVLLCAGPSRLPPEGAFFAGLLAGRLHQAAETRLRASRAAFGRAADRDAAKGRSLLGAYLASSLLAQFTMTALLVFLVLRLAQPVWSGLAGWKTLGGALRTVFMVAPWACLGSVLVSLWRRP